MPGTDFWFYWIDWTTSWVYALYDQVLTDGGAVVGTVLFLMGFFVVVRKGWAWLLRATEGPEPGAPEDWDLQEKVKRAAKQRAWQRGEDARRRRERQYERQLDREMW
jgi:hypothetical protein